MPSGTERTVLEAWSQGFMIGALFIMLGITLSNMRKGILLHKLILIEVCAWHAMQLDNDASADSRRLYHLLMSWAQLLLAVPNGFFMFFSAPAWGWFLSSTVILLITSWTLHNVIAWMKNKPFLSRRGSLIYIGSIIAVQPYWILEIYANFAYFNSTGSRLFVSTRPYEALFRYGPLCIRHPK